MRSISMAFLHHCSTHLARAVRPQNPTRFRLSSTVASVAPSSTRPVQSQKQQQKVLLGLSEKELQELALNLGQQSFRGSNFIILYTRGRLKKFRILSSCLRHLGTISRNLDGR
ncbi:PREDICTED: uncharacterized protein LOC109339831 [Lupinus angustifolius]|uniref:uncharacterized protein LOC109339831 n=1 Tax=Lupinus angustifolius TaxID=3871 RepID=UPI00092ED7B2|nr:PREDICTED: uncharacterized protein LOC109339831 [Lupinus angustifolius]